MTGALDFYFDFASPYAWFALEPFDKIARAHGLHANWTPILLWAVRKAQKLAPPMDTPARETYLMHDIQRTAEFLGLPYRKPSTFGASSHLAARTFYGMTGTKQRIAFTHAAMTAHFTNDTALNDIDALALATDIPAKEIKALAAKGRDALEAANDSALERGVWGSPFIFAGQQAFFGSDRLNQLDWYLGRKSA